MCIRDSIRNVVVEQIVLENLKEVIRYVSDYEDEFVQMVMDTDMRQRKKELNLTATLDAKAAYSDADFVIIAAPTNYDSRCV